MNPTQIDAAILNAVGTHWTKVAKVIVRVIEAMGNSLPNGDEGCHLVSQHIEELVRNGRLAAQGDTKNWRFSEIRMILGDL